MSSLSESYGGRPTDSGRKAASEGNTSVANVVAAGSIRGSGTSTQRIPAASAAFNRDVRNRQRTLTPQP